MPVRSVRLSLCPNKGKGRGKVQCVVLAKCTMEDIKKKCGNKFRVKPGALNSIRLFSSSGNEGFQEGSEINEENVNRLANGMVLVIAVKGEDYTFKDGRASGSTLNSRLQDAKTFDLPTPPQGFTLETTETLILQTLDDSDEFLDDQTKIEVPVEIQRNSFPSISLDEICFDGIFPILDGNVLDCIRQAISGSQIFVEKLGDGYIAFDYKSNFHMPSDTFPDPETAGKKSKDRAIRGIRRECRGLIICRETGRVLARRFHKFFNLNEKEETQLDSKPIGNDVFFMEKLDGSLVSPVLVPGNNNLIWMTKVVPIQSVQLFVNNNENIHQYDSFSKYWIQDKNCTPLYEWCDKERVVGQISHDSSSLVLLSIRNNITGQYISREEIEASTKEYNIPLVKKYTIQDLELSPEDSMDTVISKLSEEHNREGLVAYFPNGFMIKLKTLWYVALSSASKLSGMKGRSLLIELLKQRPTLIGVPNNIIWNSVLGDEADDLISTCCSILSSKGEKEHSGTLNSFFNSVKESIQKLSESWKLWGEQIQSLSQNQSSQSKNIIQSATVLATSNGWPSKLASVFIKGNIEQGICEIHQYLKSLLGKKNFIAIETILNVRWNFDDPNSFYHILSIGNFHQASESLQTFVLEKYFPRKVAKYLGISISELSDDTEIIIPSNYKGEEGKIKGMWEQFEKEGIIDLRVDIQPPMSTGFTDHFGDKNYCHWQIQYGASKVSKKSSKAKPGCTAVGAFAGILIQTERLFTLKQLQEALNASFESHHCVIVGDLPVDNEEKLDNTVSHIVEDVPLKKLDPNLIHVSLEERQIYCDMDGVLADFESGVLKLTGKHTSEMNVDYMWKRIISTSNFFSTLEPYSNISEFWNTICMYGNKKPIILTGLPATKYAKKVKKHKQDWCFTYLQKDVEVITCMSRDKYTYCKENSGSILIDDRLSLRSKWEEQGGIFVYHINYNNTLKILNRIFNPLDWNTKAKDDGKHLIESNLSLNNDELPTFTAKNVILVQGYEGEDLFMKSLSSATIVGFDTEWRPDELIDRNKYKKDKKSAVALIQISFHHDTAFVIDMTVASQTIITAIQTMFSDRNILKIGYGLDQDMKRLNMDLTIEPLLDLQYCIPFVLPIEIKNDKLLPLSSAVKYILGSSIQKKKLLQASDWEARPLSNEQIQYAGTDATVISSMYQKLCSYISISDALDVLVDAIITKKTKGYIFSQKDSSKNSSVTPLKTINTDTDIPKPHHQEEKFSFNNLTNDDLKQITIQYTSVVLNEESRKTLMEYFPPQYENIYYEHVTLAYKPPKELIENLPVGNTVNIKVALESKQDGKAQCIPVLSLIQSDGSSMEPWIDNRILHITLTTRRDIGAVHSNTVLENSTWNHDTPAPISLSGTVYAIVESKPSFNSYLKKIGFSPRLAEKLDDFANNSQVGEHLKFKPDELSSSERFSIHELAEKLGYQTRSEGKGNKRRLILTKGRENIQSFLDTLPLSSGFISSRDDFNKIMIAKDSGNGDNDLEKLCTKFNCDGFISNNQILLNNDIQQTGNSEYLESIEILNNILNGNITENDKFVIVMRGLPGSGKSSFGKIIMEIGNNLSIEKVSADDFFYRGAGIMKAKTMKDKTPEEIYSSCFSVNKLNDAHEFCRNSFKTAINNEINIIIVDNCNRKLSDMNFYINKSTDAGYTPIIVEIICTKDDIKTFHGRGLHKVPMKDLSRKLSQWENCSKSIKLNSTQNISITESSIQTNQTSLSRWLSAHHLIHYSKSRNASHLSMAIGNRSSCFLDVPNTLEDEFLQTYIADINTGIYLMEICTPVINMFFDVDYLSPDEISHQQILEIVQILQKGIKQASLKNYNTDVGIDELKCIVTGYIPKDKDADGMIKSGLHLNFPNYSIALSDAIHCRNASVGLLVSECTFSPSTSWEHTLDNGLYSPGRGIRMLGSRKVDNKKVDKGRVYNLITIVNSLGEELPDEISKISKNLFSLLKQTSIRNSRFSIQQ